MLRGYRANAALVPPRGDLESVKRWRESRARPSNAPMWVLDLMLAAAEQMSLRPSRGRGKPRDAATDALEFWMLDGSSAAATSRWLQTLLARREENPADNENLTDAQRKEKKDLMAATIVERAEKLARRHYRRKSKRRKPEVP